MSLLKDIKFDLVYPDEVLEESKSNECCKKFFLNSVLDLAHMHLVGKDNEEWGVRMKLNGRFCVCRVINKEVANGWAIQHFYSDWAIIEISQERYSTTTQVRVEAASEEEKGTEIYLRAPKRSRVRILFE